MHTCKMSFATSVHELGGYLLGGDITTALEVTAFMRAHNLRYMDGVQYTQLREMIAQAKRLIATGKHPQKKVFICFVENLESCIFCKATAGFEKINGNVKKCRTCGGLISKNMRVAFEMGWCPYCENKEQVAYSACNAM